MSWFTKLLGVGDLVKEVGGVVDRFIESPEEKTAAKIKIQELLQTRMSEIEQTARAELDAKQKIIVAELNQGDNYTKRARPTVVYAGLAAIIYNYSLVPTLGIFGVTVPHMPFPSEFWMAWGGIVATWSIGRTAEKRGSMNRLTGLITGSKVPSRLLD